MDHVIRRQFRYSSAQRARGRIAQWFHPANVRSTLVVTTVAPKRRRILVTDGEQRASLAVVRSLGAAGHDAFVCSQVPNSLAGASRFSIAEFVVADALLEPGRFTSDIERIVRETAIDTIIPMAEPALLALLPERERLEGVLIPFARAEAFAAICDKAAVLDAAARIGMEVPAQTLIAHADDVSSVDLGNRLYPVVVKPTRSVSDGTGVRLKSSVQHADSEVQLRDILERIDRRAYPLLIQQRVIGPGIGIFVLVWNGVLVAQFAHRRIREQPPSGGISVYRESTPVEPDLLRASLALLSQFDWSGVAMVEYKIDEATGVPYLMEINGRFWGSLQLAIDAGVDFPRLLIEAATDMRPDPVTTFNTNIRSRWFWGDVDHLIARLRKSKEELSLPPDAGPRIQAIRDFFTRHANDVNEIYRSDDRRPFVRESLRWFHQLGR